MYNIIVGISSVDRVFETVNVQSETELSRLEINKALQQDLRGHYSISFKNIQLTFTRLAPK